MGKKEPSLEEMLRRWRANLHALDIKLTRLENDRKTKTLPVRLSPGALQHVEVF